MLWQKNVQENCNIKQKQTPNKPEWAHVTIILMSSPYDS